MSDSDKKPKRAQEELVVLREGFLIFVPVYDVTGHGLATVLLNTLKELGLDLDILRLQGYDGASTMLGNFRGVQAIVKNSYPKALYTHCVAHSLNLCLSDAAKTQTIQILPNAQSSKLKSLCETRWVLCHEAVMLFREFLEPIFLSAYLSSILLSYTYHLSEYLQTKNIDLVNAPDRVNQVKIQLQILRDNATDEFNKLYEEVNRLGDKPHSNLKTVVTFYQNDLKSYDDIIEAEYKLWQSKWNLVESWPSMTIKALHQCDQLMYPIIYELLKILSNFLFQQQQQREVFQH
ncbi:52 kDa repressor of the inhibitor of the protein kinase-like [Aphis craccivora]|uniref:52 kDa repressor of the inhibitor of the protein kinase-like n=1 Tax=Aphis craccivora TaxID=307492 RepID=A0A6G0Z235_APHCR|nr:52 kDa repressor of the inhibitor of the protein kinase-like [Aphis craccivora]